MSYVAANVSGKDGRTVSGKKGRKGLSVAAQCYLLLALQITGFFVFTIYPILWAFAKAFYFYDGIDINTNFVGLQNFMTAFRDMKYWGTWIVTFKFTFYKILLEIPIALILATLLSKKYKGSGFFRSMFYLPNIISVAIIGITFSNLFSYFGVMNHGLQAFGLIKEPIDWFANAHTALGVLVVGSTWQSFGINVLYFCAALNNVPNEMYEAAEMDGAGVFVKFFKVTLPMIAPVASTILLLSINGTLHVNEYVLAMTNGAPAGSTYTVGAYLVNSFIPGFAATSVNIGYGCALSIITSVIYSAIAFIYIRGTNKLQNIY